MNDLTRDSERLIEEGRILRDDNRTGGRHRKASIGAGSARIKARHFGRKIRNILLAVGGIIMAAMVAGLIVDGIGFTGVMISVLAIVSAVFILSNYPKMKVPKRADLMKSQDVKALVGRTELWLESQRPALPPPAANVVEGIGVQLDALGVQLEGLDQQHPKAREVRKLVGEDLPEMVDSYRKIPAHLRTEKQAGQTPDEQVTQGLERISEEIDSVTRQLAQGSLDDLAIRHRYLDYKYGREAPESESG